MVKLIYSRFFTLLCSILFFTNVFSQKADSTLYPTHFGLNTTITNNGISFIPTFTLGKPAVIFDLNMGKRFTFEPQFRFSLEGKPWSFVLWMRYKLIKSNRFFLNVGGHPSFVFKVVPLTENGVTREYITTQRYLAAEVSPNYMVAKNISVGVYYLLSYGFPESVNGVTNFLTVNSNFYHIGVTKDVYLKFNPQLYYLKIDAHDGTYYNAAITLAHQHSPFSFQYLFNGPFHSDIVGGKEFVSNVSLIYSFSKKFSPTKL